MRILVLSDSHGDVNNMQYVIDRHKDAKYIIHAGDGIEQFEDLSYLYPNKKFIMVSGNNDWGSNYPYELLTQIDKTRIFIAHGHTMGVYFSTEPLYKAAVKYNAKIAIYGHTHIANVEYRDGIYIMNPGSIKRPRDGQKSYGFIDITPNGVVCAINRI